MHRAFTFSVSGKSTSRTCRGRKQGRPPNSLETKTKGEKREREKEDGKRRQQRPRVGCAHHCPGRGVRRPRMQGGGVSLMSYQVHADGLTDLAKDDGKLFKSFSAPQVNLVSGVAMSCIAIG